MVIASSSGSWPGTPTSLQYMSIEARQLAAPARAAGIVGELLIDEPAGERGPQVQVGLARARHARRMFSRIRWYTATDARVGLVGWPEAGNRPLVHELVASQVGHGEVEEHLGYGDEHSGADPAG